MTVPTENRLSGPYNGNGVTTTFGYDFRIILDGHLLVVLADADGVPTELTLNVDYTVSGAGDNAGGSIEAMVAPATGETITILRNLPFTQDTDLENQGAFQAQTIEDALDLSVMRDLVLLGRVGNSIHAPDTEEVSMELPPVALRKNAYLLFDANGEPTYVNSQIDARYYGALASDPATRPDGSAREAGDTYFSTSTLGFRVWSGSGWQVAIPPASLTLTNFTETSASAKTVFTITGGYTVGTAFAYLNGVMLAPDEVTMSNGTTAVLASACVIGDEFRLVGYSAFSVADTLSLSSSLSDLPDKPTALTNLGFSAFVQGLKAMASDALFRAGIGAQQANASLTSLSGLALVAGDMLFATGPNALARLAKGTAGQVLRMNAGLTAPEWAALSGTMTLVETIPTISGSSVETSIGLLKADKDYVFQYVGVLNNNAGNQNLRIEFFGETAAAYSPVAFIGVVSNGQRAYGSTFYRKPRQSRNLHDLQSFVNGSSGTAPTSDSVYGFDTVPAASGRNYGTAQGVSRVRWSLGGGQVFVAGGGSILVWEI